MKCPGSLRDLFVAKIRLCSASTICAMDLRHGFASLDVKPDRSGRCCGVGALRIRGWRGCATETEQAPVHGSLLRGSNPAYFDVTTPMIV
jgi:hypothetical protein